MFPIFVPSVDWTTDRLVTQAAAPWNCQAPFTTGAVPMTVPPSRGVTTSLMR